MHSEDEASSRLERSGTGSNETEIADRGSAMVRSMLALLLLVMPAGSFAVEAPVEGPADAILLDGQVLVFSGPERHDGAGPPKFEQALAIRDGRIVFIGTSEAARKYVGPKTSVTDLQGRMVMPGIVDGHFHGNWLTDCEMGYAGGTLRRSSRSCRRASIGPTKPPTRGPTSASSQAISSARRSCRAERRSPATTSTGSKRHGRSGSSTPTVTSSG